MTKKIYKERRLYFFKCSECGRENRQSFHRKKTKVGICRKCKRNVVDPNQGELFPLKIKELQIA